MNVLIIAEAGVNHDGRLDNALKLVAVAAEAGADYVKFQTFVPEQVVTTRTRRAQYQIRAMGDGTQLEMIKKLALNEEAHRVLVDECHKQNIRFLSTPFDHQSVMFLDQLGLDTIKIPSGEITNLPYLRLVGSLRKNVIMSTGMAELHEVDRAISILTGAGTELQRLVVLHCNTEYPTPIEDANLKAMVTMARTFGVRVGYSDHTLGIEASIAAVALGAEVIEKHFTLDRSLVGPDHKASILPEELAQLVQAIRRTEKALGSGIKKPSPSEMKNRDVIRRSIVAAVAIRKGERFCEENLTVKRPANGLSPMLWDEVIGRLSDRYYEPDEEIVI